MQREGSAMESIHGTKVTGKVVKTYDNTVLIEDESGQRYVVHREELEPNFKRKRSTKHYNSKGFDRDGVMQPEPSGLTRLGFTRNFQPW